MMMMHAMLCTTSAKQVHHRACNLTYRSLPLCFASINGPLL